MHSSPVVYYTTSWGTIVCPQCATSVAAKEGFIYDGKEHMYVMVDTGNLDGMVNPIFSYEQHDNDYCDICGDEIE